MTLENDKIMYYVSAIYNLDLIFFYHYYYLTFICTEYITKSIIKIIQP